MKDTKRITYGRTSVYNLNYHLIWGTKYRNKVLKGHVEEVLKHLLYDIASKYGFMIAHMEIGKDDHIHLLVSAPPKLSVTNIMRWLKHGTSSENVQNYKLATGKSKVVTYGHQVIMLKALGALMNKR